MFLDFTEALKKQSSTEQADILKRVSLLDKSNAFDRQCRYNLYQEPRFPEEEWQKLFDEILCAGHSSLKDVRNRIRSFCRSHLLQGPVAKIPSSSKLARVTTLNSLTGILIKQFYCLTRSEAKACVRFALMNKDLRVIYPYRDWVLGRFLMWSTLSMANETVFPAPSLKTDRLLCILGLAPCSSGDLVLAMEFRLPSSEHPMIPRFHEAYAGDYWSYYFRPNLDPNGKFGRTFPRPDCSGHSGRSEVVHKPITASNLTRMAFRT